MITSSNNNFTINNHYLWSIIDSVHLISMRIGNNSKLKIKPDIETFTILVSKKIVAVSVISWIDNNIRVNNNQLFVPKQRISCPIHLRKVNSGPFRLINLLKINSFRILIKRNRNYNSVIRRQRYSFNSFADRLFRRVLINRCRIRDKNSM